MFSCSPTSLFFSFVSETQRITYREDVPIEAILTMPVGFDAVVTGLSATIDGRKLIAKAKIQNAAHHKI